MNSNKRKLVEEFKAGGLSPKAAYDKMMRINREVKIIGKRKTDANRN